MPQSNAANLGFVRPSSSVDWWFSITGSLIDTSSTKSSSSGDVSLLSLSLSNSSLSTGPKTHNTVPNSLTFLVILRVSISSIPGILCKRNKSLTVATESR